MKKTKQDGYDDRVDDEDDVDVWVDISGDGEYLSIKMKDFVQREKKMVHLHIDFDYLSLHIVISRHFTELVGQGTKKEAIGEPGEDIRGVLAERLQLSTFANVFSDNKW